MARVIVIALIIFLCAPLAGYPANSSLNFGGVGIDGAPQADGRIVVKQLVTGGPAHLAGVRIGDVITHIDSKPTRGSNFAELIEHRLRGRAGTKVMISIVRPGEDKPRSFTLVRKQLVIGK